MPNYTPAQLIQKWSPLLEGLPLSDTSAETTAHCLESEARFLRAMSDEDRQGTIGQALKFYFPIIRVVVPELSALDRLAALDKFDEHVLSLVKRRLKECIDVRPSEDGSYTYESLQGSPALASFAERLSSSYLSLQG